LRGSERDASQGAATRPVMSVDDPTDPSILPSPKGALRVCASHPPCDRCLACALRIATQENYQAPGRLGGGMAVSPGQRNRLAPAQTLETVGAERQAARRNQERLYGRLPTWSSPEGGT